MYWGDFLVWCEEIWGLVKEGIVIVFIVGLIVDVLVNLWGIVVFLFILELGGF